MNRPLLRFAAFATLLLTACAGPPAPPAPSGQQFVQDDQFSQEATVSGLEAHSKVRLFGEDDDQWGFYLRSFINKRTQQVEHQLYFHVDYRDYGGKRIYAQAADEGANLLPFKNLGSEYFGCNGHGCEYREDTTADLTNDLLRAHIETGFKVKFSARGGDPYVLEVTGEQIQDQYAAIDNYFQLHKFFLPEALTMPSLKAGTAVARLGVEVMAADNYDVQHAGLPAKQGVRMYRIASNSPAERNGLLVDDIITAYNGKPVATPADLAAAAGAGPEHGQVSLTLFHIGAPGKPDTATFDLDATAVAGAVAPTGLGSGPRGIALANVDQKLATYLKMPSVTGVAVSKVDPGSPFQVAGLRTGDVILAYDGKPIARGEDFQAAVRASQPGTTAQLQVYRPTGQLTIPVSYPPEGSGPAPATGAGPAPTAASPPTRTASATGMPSSPQVTQANGAVTLGVTFVNAIHMLAVPQINQKEHPAGANIVLVRPDTPGARAGIHILDIVTSYDGKPIASQQDLLDAVRTSQPGTQVKIVVWRDGETQTLTAAY